MNNHETYNNYLKAISAIKDALFMYKTLIDYGYFFDDFSFESGEFSPEIYLEFNWREIGLDEDDALFLKEASVIKLICQIRQNKLINNGVANPKYSKIVSDVISKGKIRDFADLENYIKELMDIKSNNVAKDNIETIFEKYIITRFKEYLGLP